MNLNSILSGEKKSDLTILDCAHSWMPDQGDNTYRNPIIHADYSDPDVIRVGDDFFLTASSFHCTPGLPILHSMDLVNWTIINHAVQNLPHSRYAEVQPGCGIWAPAMRFHARKFWIYFPMPDEGIYVTTSTDPAGKWSAPHLVQAGKGLIDPCPLWDDDGKAYLVHAYAHSRSGIKHMLRVRPMSPDGSRLLGEGDIVSHDPKRHPTLEGPKFFKRNGWYYISAPAGGVETGWQVVLRSKNVFGPYEEKVVLAQGNTDTNGPHQGALVDTKAGEWWFVHFQDAGVYGRITHLQPVEWREDWPLIGEVPDVGSVGEPVAHSRKPVMTSGEFRCVPQTSDEFDSCDLGLQWQWNANHRTGWSSLATRKSWLRLFPQPVRDHDLGRLPNLLLQKFPARSFTAETSLEFSPGQAGEEAGLIVAGESTSTLAIEKVESGNQIVLRVNGVQKAVHGNLPNSVRLRVTVKEGGVCVFGFAAYDGFVEISGSFPAQKGVWIGARLGVYSLKRSEQGATGHVDFDYFRFVEPRSNSGH